MLSGCNSGESEKDVSASLAGVNKIDGNGLPITEEQSTISVWFPVSEFYSPIASDLSEIYSLRLIEEQTNIHLDFTSVPSMTSNEQFPIMIASMDWCDVMTDVNSYYIGGVDKAIDDGIIQDLTDLIRNYCPNLQSLMDADEDVYRGMTTEAGGIAFFPSLNNERDPGPTNGYMIRQDWLDELNLEIPTTYDELYDVLVAFNTTYGATMFVAPDFVTVENNLAAGFDINGNVGSDIVLDFGIMQIDGVVKSSLLEDGYLKFLKLMNEWWEEGLIDDSYGQYFMEFIQDHYDGILTGRNGISQGDSDLLESLAPMAEDPNFELSPMADIGLTNGQVLHYGNPPSIFVGNQGRCWFMSTQCENPEIVTRFCNFLYSDDAMYLYNYGTEDYTYYIPDDGSYRYTDFILNNEDYTATQMLCSYLCHNTTPFPIIKIVDREFYSLSDKQYDAICNIWASNNDYAYNIPSYVTLNSEEQERFNEISSDLYTYVSENHLAFIIGVKSFNEFDTFIAQLKALGIEEIISLYQAAYNRVI